MSPRNWPDLPHGCKLSQLETAMQLIQRSIRWTDPVTETKSQWVSPAAPLASPLKLFSTGFLEHICSYKSSSQTGTCKPSPRDGISQMCTFQYMWSQPVIWWDQGGERKWSWEKIWTRANLSPGPFSLLSLPVPLSLLWVLHSFVFMFVITFSASSQKAQRLRAECPLQPQTSQRSGFCGFLCLSSFLKSLQKCYFTLASCWTWP